MARTSRIAWILITSMMLTSLFAGMDWEEKSLEEFDEMKEAIHDYGNNN